MSPDPSFRAATVPLARAWSTWAADRPAEMLFLPLGLRLTPLAYSARADKATLFPPGSAVRYGRHAPDASLVELDLAHAGTALAWRYVKPDPFAVVGDWTAVATGEWGLRFWVCLCLSADDGAVWSYDEGRGVAWAAFGPRVAAVAAAPAPLLVTGHETVAAVAEELEDRGYFYLGSRADRGRVLALRFNLEEAPAARFAAALADDRDVAIERALALAAAAPVAPPLAMQTGADAGALDAVRDVVGWNTVWDPVNRRAYTGCSRNWDRKKFGGFGVWLNDVVVHALLAAPFDADQARDNLMAVVAGATPDGNLPCLLTGNDAWLDRSQSPIAAFVTWLVHQRTGSRPLLELAYEPLRRNHDWWWRRRDGNGNRILEFGTSPVGRGLYRGTKLGAKDESFMDNSPIHDEAQLVPEAGTLDCEDVGLNCLVALDAEMLARIAAALGDRAGADRFEAIAAEHRARIRSHFWDESRGIFANRLWSGDFVRSVAPTSFYPLLAGAAAPDQTARLLAHLRDPGGFGGGWILPSTRRDDPAYGDNVYWRGRVWPPLNWLVWHGLRRAGLDGEATALADAGWRMFRANWESGRVCGENFNAETGEALDQADTDGFYSWGALLPALAAAEIMDVNPWGGWELTNAGGDVVLGPLTAPIGRITVVRRGGVMALEQDGRTILSTDVPGRLRHLAIEPARIAVRLPADLPAGHLVRLPAVAPATVLLARQGAQAADWTADGDGIAIRCAVTGTDGALLTILLDAACRSPTG